MNVITMRGSGKVHTRASGVDGVQPLCMPYGGRGTTHYRTTPKDVSCGRCMQSMRPQYLVQLREAAETARMLVTTSYKAQETASYVVTLTPAGTPARLIADAVLRTAKDASRANERAWRYTVAAYIATVRLARKDGPQFPPDEMERQWATEPGIAALIAAYEAN